MIRGFERNPRLEPADKDRWQIGPAVGAGFIAAVILLLIPRGSPWAALTFFKPVILGRDMSAAGLMPAGAYVLHLAVSILCGLFISRVVAGLKKERAIFAGGFLGLVLYVINFGVVSTWWPETRGGEVSVVFTHIVFGLITAAAYRGLLRRSVASTSAGDF